MYLLDTDTLTHLYAGHPKVIKQLNAVSDPEICTTVITKIELLRGRYDFLLKALPGVDIIKAQQNLLTTEELIEQIQIVYFDDGAVSHLNRLTKIKKLKRIGHADILIASITLSHNATLVTRNIRHFRKVPGVEVVNWVD